VELCMDAVRLQDLNRVRITILALPLMAVSESIILLHVEELAQQ
jgi:hypothetical protein